MENTKIAGSGMFRMSLFILASLITLCALIYTGLNWMGERSWRRYQSDSEALGERQSLSAFIPPAVPDQDNFAKTPLLSRLGYRNPKSSAPVLSRNINWQMMGSFREGKWTRFDLDGASNEPSRTPAQINGAKVMIAEMDHLKAEMDELRAAAHRPSSRFDTDGTFEGVVPNFVFLRTMGQSFQWHALASIATGDNSAALEDVKVINKIADGLRGSPTLVATMVRSALLGLDKQPFYEGWAAKRWTESDYQALQTLFASQDCLRNVEMSIRDCEKLGVAQLVNNHTGQELVDTFNLQTSEAATKPFVAWISNGLLHSLPRGWWLRNLVVHQTMMDHVLNAAFSPGPNRVNPRECDGINAWIDHQIGSKWPFNVIAAVSIPNIGKALCRAAEAQATSDQAAIVCALERHKIRTGQYPARLEELAPTFLANLPKDPVSGQIPLYRRNSDGTFLLYNVGWNASDDGGNPSPQGNIFTAGDFVWPFPTEGAAALNAAAR